MSGIYYYQPQALNFFKVSDDTPFSTMSASLYSSDVNLNNAYGGVVNVVWTGSPVGTLAVVGSLDGVTWNIPLYSQAAGGAGGNFVYDLAQTSVGFWQIQYTFGSSTGALSTTWTKKFEVGLS